MKKKNQPHWIMAQIAEQEAPGSTINLWSQVQARVASPVAKTHKTILSSRKGQIAFGLMLVLMLIGSLFFVPTARAFVEGILQRMGIAFVDTERYEEAQVQAPAEVIKVTPRPSMSIEEVRKLVSFSLLTPTWLPDDLNYVHRSVHLYTPGELDGGGVQVNISYYRRSDLDFQSGVLSLRANDGPIGAPPLLAESRKQPVTVNGQPGIYVHGGWQDDGSGDPNTKMGILQWDDQADDAYLTWTQDGVTYLLEAHNLGADLDVLLRIAESMTNK